MGALLIAGIAAWTMDFAAFSTPAFAQTDAEPAPAKPAQKPPRRPRPAPQAEPAANAAPAAPASAEELFGKHAADAGVKTCAATYAGLGKALTEGSQFVVQTQTNKAEPDRHALQGLVSMSSNSKDYTGPAAGLVFAAPTGGGCEGTIVRVVPFQQDCQAAAALLPQGSQQLQPLGGLPLFQLANGGQILLMPSGQGCVVVSTVRGAS